MSEKIEVQSLVRLVWEHVFLKGVQFNPLAVHSGWVGGWLERSSAFDATVLFIFHPAKMNCDTGEMKTAYLQEMLKALSFAVNLAWQTDSLLLSLPAVSHVCKCLGMSACAR